MLYNVKSALYLSFVSFNTVGVNAYENPQDVVLKNLDLEVCKKGAEDGYEGCALKISQELNANLNGITPGAEGYTEETLDDHMESLVLVRRHSHDLLDKLQMPDRLDVQPMHTQKYAESTMKLIIDTFSQTLPDKSMKALLEKLLEVASQLRPETKEMPSLMIQFFQDEVLKTIEKFAMAPFMRKQILAQRGKSESASNETWLLPVVKSDKSMEVMLVVADAGRQNVLQSVEALSGSLKTRVARAWDTIMEVMGWLLNFLFKTAPKQAKEALRKQLPEEALEVITVLPGCGDLFKVVDEEAVHVDSEDEAIFFWQQIPAQAFEFLDKDRKDDAANKLRNLEIPEFGAMEPNYSKLLEAVKKLLTEHQGLEPPQEAWFTEAQKKCQFFDTVNKLNKKVWDLFREACKAAAKDDVVNVKPAHDNWAAFEEFSKKEIKLGMSVNEIIDKVKNKVKELIGGEPAFDGLEA